jgi:hypothetical protein
VDHDTTTAKTIIMIISPFARGGGWDWTWWT